MRSGEIYSDDSYYILSGFATDGTSWKADHVLPNCDWPPEEAKLIVHRRLSSIMGGESATVQPRTYLPCIFFEKVDLPVPIREGRNSRPPATNSTSRRTTISSLSRRNQVTRFPSISRCVLRKRPAFSSLHSRSRPRAIVHGVSVVLISRMLKSSIVQLGPPLALLRPHGLQGPELRREVAQAGLLMI